LRQKSNPLIFPSYDEITALNKAGMTYAEIAAHFHVPVTRIKLIMTAHPCYLKK
jgi:hypothetical protein